MDSATLHITKMHGLGNCYIYVNEFEHPLPEAVLPKLARKVSDVHTGIGSDGLILIGPSDQADFRMRIFNIDGSEGKNCGNGLRCVAKYAVERGLTDRTAFTIETLSGIVDVQVHLQERSSAKSSDASEPVQVESVTVNMGNPRLFKRELPMAGAPDSMTVDEEVIVGGEPHRLTAVSMGNPHAVFFVPDVHDVDLERIGPRIEHDPMFPERINVEFVHAVNRRELDFRVWERGSGITQACGTGACAAVVAGVLNGLVERDVPVTVHLPGGDLEIVWAQGDSNVYMKGPAEFVLDGEFRL
jgi:diaminopimelate epimerase